MLTDSQLTWIRERAEDEGVACLHDIRRLLDEIDRLRGENARLRQGDFTSDEFQALCYHFDRRKPGCTREEFEAGCLEYQRKLFGEKRGGE
jgi:hypothetical protein